MTMILAFILRNNALYVDLMGDRHDLPLSSLVPLDDGQRTEILQSLRK